MVGTALALHALVSLILLSSALAHCLPRSGHHLANEVQSALAGVQHHDQHHGPGHHTPAAPGPLEPQDDCCSLLCRVGAGHALAPAPEPTRVASLTYTVQAALLPSERPIPTRRWSPLPLGSRAPPTVA